MQHLDALRRVAGAHVNIEATYTAHKARMRASEAAYEAFRREVYATNHALASALAPTIPRIRELLAALMLTTTFVSYVQFFYALEAAIERVAERLAAGAYARRALVVTPDMMSLLVAVWATLAETGCITDVLIVGGGRQKVTRVALDGADGTQHALDALIPFLPLRCDVTPLSLSSAVLAVFSYYKASRAIVPITGVGQAQPPYAADPRIDLATGRCIILHARGEQRVKLAALLGIPEAKVDTGLFQGMANADPNVYDLLRGYFDATAPPLYYETDWHLATAGWPHRTPPFANKTLRALIDDTATTVTDETIETKKKKKKTKKRPREEDAPVVVATSPPFSPRGQSKESGYVVEFHPVHVAPVRPRTTGAPPTDKRRRTETHNLSPLTARERSALFRARLKERVARGEPAALEILARRRRLRQNGRPAANAASTSDDDDDAEFNASPGFPPLVPPEDDDPFPPLTPTPPPTQSSNEEEQEDAMAWLDELPSVPLWEEEADDFINPFNDSDMDMLTTRFAARLRL